MRLCDRAAQLNTDGMNAESIRAAHCPSWYGLPDIEGCPKTEIVQVGKRKVMTKQVKTLDRCHECWNREERTQ